MTAVLWKVHMKAYIFHLQSPSMWPKPRQCLMSSHCCCDTGCAGCLATHLCSGSCSNRGPRSRTYSHCLHNLRTRTGYRSRSACQRTTSPDSLCMAFQGHSQVSMDLSVQLLERATNTNNTTAMVDDKTDRQGEKMSVSADCLDYQPGDTTGMLT